MNRVFSALLIAPVVFTLAGCVSTSEVRSPGEAMGLAATYDPAELTSVTVMPFTVPADVQEEDAEEHRNSGEHFAELIYTSLAERIGAERVSYNTPADTGLIVTGEVTKAERGNAVMRAMIGFGAGAISFDAKVQLIDAASGVTTGVIDIDSSSGIAGGTLGLVQSYESYMKTAADEVAAEIVGGKANQSGTAASTARKLP